MLSRSVALLCLCVFCPSLTSAEEKTPPILAPDSTQITRETRKSAEAIRRKMQTKVDLEFRDTPLNEALEFLADRGGFPVQIDKQAFEEDRIAVDHPITEVAPQATIEQVLLWILEPSGLAWVIENETLKVTTEIEADDHLVTRSYDVKWLLDLDRGPRADEPTVDTGGCQTGGNEWHWLVGTILEVTRGPWLETDGVGGTLSIHAGVLTVSNTIVVQDQVNTLLRSLKAFADGKAEAGAIAIRPATYPLAADQAIVAALVQKSDFKYSDTPLSDVVADLGRRMKIHARIDVPALTENGIQPGQAITIDVRNVTYASLLKLILKPHGVIAIAEWGALTITSEIVADEKVYPQAYDVGDLVSNNDFDALIELIAEATSGPWWDRGGTGGSVAVAEPLGVLVFLHVERVPRGDRPIAGRSAGHSLPPSAADSAARKTGDSFLPGLGHRNRHAVDPGAETARRARWLEIGQRLAGEHRPGVNPPSEGAGSQAGGAVPQQLRLHPSGHVRGRGMLWKRIRRRGIL